MKVRKVNDSTLNFSCNSELYAPHQNLNVRHFLLYVHLQLLGFIRFWQRQCKRQF